MSTGGNSHDPARAASDPSRSAWVSANAGAGKTYTLATRVARLLLADVPPQRILCLTFTKAAAAEMSRRLFNQLGAWAMLPDTRLEEEIANIGGALRERGELQKARWLFAKALETPGGLKIQTIHAFCQNILSRFPVEAGVPPFFRILDEQTARELLSEARSKVMEAAGAGQEDLAEAVAVLTTQASDFRLEQILESALGNDRRKIERFIDRYARNQRIAVLRTAHGAQADDTPEGIGADFCERLKRDRAGIRDIVDWMGKGAVTDKNRSAGLAQALATDFAEGSFDLIRVLFLTNQGEPVAKLVTKKLAEARPDLLARLEALAASYYEAADRQRAALAARLADAALTLLDAVREAYGAAKRRRNALDYDDLVAKTQDLLENRAASAWVLYKLDGGIDHLLIDEAQDTSPEQWAIVRKLTEEFFSGNSLPENPRTIFAVGDEKQSIFSFQGADPAQFDINRRHFHAAVENAEQLFNYEYLQTSRRSAPEILTFVDRVFSDEAARAGLTSDGAPIHHEPLDPSSAGLVEFWPAEKPQSAPEPDWWRPVDIPSESSAVVRLAARIADQIKDWTRGDRYLPGRDRAISPGDIMILLPRREPFGSEIIRQLKSRKIPVSGSDRIRLTEQIAVMDLIALGRFAIQHDDDLNLASLLRTPLLNLSEEDLFDLAHQRRGTLWAELASKKRNKPVLGKAFEFLSSVLASADFVAPYEFFAGVLTGRKLRNPLLARLGAEASDAIEEFLSLALAFERENTPSLEGFLHWVERGGAEIKRDMEHGRGEVRVMTVHGAKGLEADIVILPDTTSLPEQPSRKGQLLHTEDAVLFPISGDLAPQRVKTAKETGFAETLKEHRRLLYVALTRAKKRLYICGFENKRGVNEQSWYALAEQAALDLATPETHGDTTVHSYGRRDLDVGSLSFDAVLDKPAIPAWALSNPPAEAQAPRLIRPSVAEDPQTDELGERTPTVLSPVTARDGFQRGRLVHSLLAHLPELPGDQRLQMALRYLKSHNVLPSIAQELAEQVIGVLNDPSFAEAFVPGSRAEVAIAADLPDLGPGSRVHGQIDRLAVTDSQVLILDYKTNRTPPKTEADVPALYLTQMALYRAGIARIFPDKRISCGLIWTSGPVLMPLSPRVLDAQFDRLRSRLADRRGNT